jgi:hypothetical protein
LRNRNAGLPPTGAPACRSTSNDAYARDGLKTSSSNLSLIIFFENIQTDGFDIGRIIDPAGNPWMPPPVSYMKMPTDPRWIVGI